MNIQKTHLGIYGVLINEGKILLIKKSRGPYKGRLDLPGGKLEHGEDLIAALTRELKEETGVVVTDARLLSNTTTLVSFEDEGDVIEMYHVGLIYKILGSDNNALIFDMDEEDSLGAEWVVIDNINLENLSPFARYVIENKLYA